MYRLNVKITEEAAEILKDEAKRIGTTMGTIITLWALDKYKENNAFRLVNIYEAESKKAQTPSEQG